jgi:hypothetical protein
MQHKELFSKYDEEMILMAEPEISIKNTKAEILDALQEARKKAEQAEQKRLDPEKEEKEKVEKKAVESAKQAVGQNIFSKELNDKFNDLQTAIALEENRLQELYGVGREVQKLALAIEAGRERIAEIEAERTEKEVASKASLESLKAEYEEKNTALKSEYEQKNAALKAEYEQKNTALKADYDQKNTIYKEDYDTTVIKLKVERARESEEFQYNQKRLREKENNAWADQKAERESELQSQETRARELLADAESKAGYIRELEEKAAGVPDLIAAEKEAAVSAATEALNREHNHQKAIAELEYKNAVERLEEKVVSLEKQLAASNKATEVLQNKLDKAYSEMRDLAAKTVESTGSLKILGNPDKVSG